MFEKVKKAIDQWNPDGLLPVSPGNIFDVESKMIAERIEKDDSVEQIAWVVSAVFKEEFEPDGEGYSVKDCMSVAGEIKKLLEA